MVRRAPPSEGARDSRTDTGAASLPRPTLQFRLRAWREFQRALDPLAPPKRLRLPRPQR